MPKTFCLVSMALCLAAVVLRAEEPAADMPTKASAAEFKVTPEQESFFEQKIRPILVARCFECHGEKKQEGGLRLDSRSSLTKGNDAGPAIVPGKPDESRIVEVIGYQ